MSTVTDQTTPGLIDMILIQLQAPEERRLRLVVDQIIEENDTNRGVNSQVISHNSEVFWHTNSPVQSSAKKVPPNLSLHLGERMTTFQAERDKLKSDMAQIKDLLRSMIGNASKASAQEIRNKIPDCLIQYAPGWVATTPRSEDLQHAHRYDRTLWKRYTMLQGKIDMYAAMGLLY